MMSYEGISLVADHSESACRNEAMAAALRLLHTRLGASTSTVYLLTGDGRELATAVAVDSPLGVTVTRRISVDVGWRSSAKAHRTGERAIMRDAEIQKLIRDAPAMVLYVPFPMLVVSVPLRTEEYR